MGTCLSYCLVIFIVFQHHRYILSQFSLLQTSDWYSGDELCNADGKMFGVIGDFYDTTLLYKLLVGNGYSEVWIGLFYNVSLGIYHWTNGTIVGTYQPWYINEGEPNCLPRLNCNIDCVPNCTQFCIRGQLVGTTVVWRTQFCDIPLPILCSPATIEATVVPTMNNIYNTPTRELTKPHHNRLTSSAKDVQEVTSSTMGYGKVVTKHRLISSTNYLQKTTVQSDISSPDGYDLPTAEKTTTSATGFRAIVYCPSDVDSICKCEIIKNVTLIEKNINLDSLLKIDKRKTSTFIRKNRSSKDERFSAKVMGYTGFAVLVVVAMLVVCMDVMTIKLQNRR